MHNRLFVLTTLLLTVTTSTVGGQTALQLRWELTADTNAAFTLTNRDTKPLPPTGWAIYFSALHSAKDGSVGAGFEIQDVLGGLHRLDVVAVHGVAHAVLILARFGFCRSGLRLTAHPFQFFYKKVLCFVYAGIF